MSSIRFLTGSIVRNFVQPLEKVRKQGGLCTGITQNLVDMLQNYTAMTMLGNSEFIALLKQSNVDSQELSTAAGIPEAQLKYVDNSPSGTGIIKYGNTCIPFDNRMEKKPIRCMRFSIPTFTKRRCRQSRSNVI